MMNEQIRRNIILIALDNLIQDYHNALEDKELTLGPDERELALNIIEEAEKIFNEESQEVDNHIIQRPQWKKT